MFNIPQSAVTQIGALEVLYVAQVGGGKAILGGKKVTLEIPSEGIKLGQRFIATPTNTLIPFEQFKGVTVAKKISSRTISGYKALKKSRKGK